MTAGVTAPAVEVIGLTKVYGEVSALDSLTFSVPEGSVFGFLGPNGAGKTTTLRILTGLARQTQGLARVLGRDVGDADTMRLIGFLPDVSGFYPWMTADGFLRFVGGLFGLDAPTLNARVPVLLDLAGLAGVNSRVGGFSRGMKQRLGVAQALINAPRLLMLDEPTSALDPLGRREVLDMITSLGGRTTVLFSTHILADVERVCDTVAILDHGHVVVQAPIGELKARYGAHRLTLEVDRAADELAEVLSARSWSTGITRTEDGGLSIAASDVDAAQRDVPVIIAERGLALRRFEVAEVSLEEVFVDLVSEGDHRTVGGGD